MNQAEVIHAGWAHRDRSNLSLLVAAHIDTRDSVLLEAQLKEYKEGTSSGGTGPSHKERTYRRELEEATRCGREINELARTVDGESAYRPLEQRKGKKNTKGKEAAQTKNKNKVPCASTSPQNVPTPADKNLPLDEIVFTDVTTFFPAYFSVMFSMFCIEQAKIY